MWIAESRRLRDGFCGQSDAASDTSDRFDLIDGEEAPACVGVAGQDEHLIAVEDELSGYPVEIDFSAAPEAAAGDRTVGITEVTEKCCDPVAELFRISNRRLAGYSELDTHLLFRRNEAAAVQPCVEVVLAALAGENIGEDEFKKRLTALASGAGFGDSEDFERVLENVICAGIAAGYEKSRKAKKQ